MSQNDPLSQERKTKRNIPCEELISQQTACTALTASFFSLYRWLDNRTIAWRVVIGMLVIHTGLLMYSAYVHSPTFNEPAHLVAGLSHWKFNRFDLYRVNPPLIRMIAALPVMAVGFEEEWSGFFEYPGSRPVFGMGEGFMASNGERSFFLFTIARWGCIPLSWVGGIVCFLWAKDLYGNSAGILACSLWCFSPNILAHASLLTADAGGSALGIAACYTFWRWLRNPTWTQAMLTGVVLGLAELAKTTLILFYPLWPCLWVMYRWSERCEMKLGDWVREAGMLFARLVIGIYVLNLGYGFEGSFMPLKEFHFVSDFFSGQENEVDSGSSSIVPDNCFSSLCLGGLPAPFPKNYILGIDIQQRDFENYSRPSFLRGKWSNRGWWYYYLYAALIKIPLGTLLLGTLLLYRQIIRCWNKTLPIHSTNTPLREELVLLLPATLIFLVVSLKTGFSEHFRYVLPCFPFFFVWVSRIVSVPVYFENHVSSRRIATSCTVLPSTSLNASRRRLATLLLIFWSVSSSLSIYPHSLSYFNEAVGGPRFGPRHLLGSNVDWGQDFLYVRKWHNSLSKVSTFRFYMSHNGGGGSSCCPGLEFIDIADWFSDGRLTGDAAFSYPVGVYVVDVNSLSSTTCRRLSGGVFVPAGFEEKETNTGMIGYSTRYFKRNPHSASQISKPNEVP